MNQKQINAFRMVMIHGSITAAASALNVSQPAVSRLLADLEASLGFALMVRTGSKVHPTPEAYDFFPEVERMYYGIDRLTQVAAKIGSLKRGTFRFASMPMASFEIVPRTVKLFLQRHDGIDVMHDVHTSPRIVDLLASRQLDLGLVQVQMGRTDLDVLAAFQSECVCAMAPDNPLAKRQVLTPQDLRDEPLIALNHRTLTYIYMTQRFAEADTAPRIVAETQPSFSACGLARLGVGVAIVDPLTPAIFADSLKSVPFKPSIPFEFQVLKPKDVPLSRVAKAFLDQLLETIAALPMVRRRA